jgi:hypothetical protein
MEFENNKNNFNLNKDNFKPFSFSFYNQIDYLLFLLMGKNYFLFF